MTLSTICKKLSIEDKEEYGNIEISDIYYSDLMSNALAKLHEKNLFVTVINNVNTLAVAINTKASGILLVEGVEPNDELANASIKYGFPILTTELNAVQAISKLLS